MIKQMTREMAIEVLSAMRADRLKPERRIKNAARVWWMTASDGDIIETIQDQAVSQANATRILGKTPDLSDHPQARNWIFEACEEEYRGLSQYFGFIPERGA